MDVPPNALQTNQEARLYAYLESNYSIIRLQRISGSLKRSWIGQSENGGYTWACLIPFESNNKNAVVFQVFIGQRTEPIATIKVVLNIAPARFKGRRGASPGDFFFRLDVVPPFEKCCSDPKDYHADWKNFILPGSFDISDDEKARRQFPITPTAPIVSSAVLINSSIPPINMTPPTSDRSLSPRRVQDHGRWQSDREKEYYERYKSEHFKRIFEEKRAKIRKEEEEKWNKRRLEIEKIVEEEAETMAAETEASIFQKAQYQ